MNFPGKQKSSGSKEVDLNPLLPELFVLQGFSVRKNKSAKPFVSTVSHFCGRSEETRTPDILLPNKNYSLFCLVNVLFDPFFTVFGAISFRYFR